MTTTAARGHGGALIIVKDEGGFELIQPYVKIKYQMEFSSALQALVACAKDEYRRERADRVSEDAADLISSLTAVDGSVILTDHFRVLGFGGQVRVDSSPEQVAVAIDWSGTIGSMVPVDSFGTRHRSAFRLCSKVAGIVVFLISQDGELRAVKQSAHGEVELWNNVSAYGFGEVG